MLIPHGRLWDEARRYDVRRGKQDRFELRLIENMQNGKEEAREQIKDTKIPALKKRLEETRMDSGLEWTTGDEREARPLSWISRSFSL